MIRFATAFFAGICLTYSALPAMAQMLEQETQRAGATYMRAPINGGAQQCWTMCARDTRCKAWTWQRPGISGPQGICSLKMAVTTARANPCCVSGVSSRLEQQIELGLYGHREQRQSARMPLVNITPRTYSSSGKNTSHHSNMPVKIMPRHATQRMPRHHISHTPPLAGE